MASSFLPPGKLPAALLDELLQQQEPTADPWLLIGPRPGEDAAVIDFGERLLIAKSDPITFATDAIGYYAVNVNANDIASMGGTPRWFLATLLLPEKGTTADLVRDIFAQIREACRALQVTLVGGHTEITLGLDRPLICGQMLGETTRAALVTSAGAQVGDAVLLTKGYPLEGSAIIARERAAQLAEQGFEAGDVARWQGLLFDPGISVVRDAAVLQQAVEVHAMHDPTEGGVATGLRELAGASNVGMHLQAEQLPLLPEGRMLCDAFGLDPLGVIASGALLTTVPAAQAAGAIRACNAARIACYDIGRVVPPGAGLLLSGQDTARQLPNFTRDEIVKLFEAEGSYHDDGGQGR
jgi:hydrogenase maturation factor